MDPALWEMLDGNPDDEVAAVIRLRDAADPPPAVRVVARFGEVATCRLRRADIPVVRYHPSVLSLKAPRLYTSNAVAPSDAVGDAEPGPNDERRPPEEPSTGRGAVVAVVDWGCDFAHADFRRADGSTRLLAMWDQRPAANPRRSPALYRYGTVHTTADIDRALAAPDPYVALGYHPADSDPDGSGSHGTHVLGIAAGNGRAGGPEGLAPGADLVFVQLSAPTGGDTPQLGDSVALLEALDFIARTAADRPCVINLSLGRHAGSHDGTSLVERAFDHFVTDAPRRAIVQSAGNYFDRRVHVAGQLRSGDVHAFRWYVDEGDKTGNELDLWYPRPDRMGVEVIAPDGAAKIRVGPGEQAAIEVGGRRLGTAYHRIGDPNNLDNEVDVFLYPGAPPGAWEVRLTGDDVADGRFHAWIERDAVCRGCQSRFDEGDAVRLTTTGTICNGYRTVVVGAYDAHSGGGEMAPFSSSGPTRDGRPKPDLVAPGVRILAARSGAPGPYTGVDRLTRKSGTSMAAPHVTGTIACMFEAAGRPLPVREVRGLLLASCVPPDPELSAEDRARVGGGYLDSGRAIAAARIPPAAVEATDDASRQEFEAAALRTPEAPSPAVVDATTETPEGDEPMPNHTCHCGVLADAQATETDDSPVPSNAYVYIVGAEPGTDLDAPQQTLQDEAGYEAPWVEMVFDLREPGGDLSIGRLRTRRQADTDGEPRNEERALGSEFADVLREIAALPAANARVRQLHLLAYTEDDELHLRPGEITSASDLDAIDRTALATAFADDALVKIHVGREDRDIAGLIREYCGRAWATRRRELLADIRNRLDRSYAYRLARAVGREVWAVPLGAVSSDACGGDAKRLCVAPASGPRGDLRQLLRFYQANYSTLFGRNPGEDVFDDTSHMKYKPELKSESGLNPAACAVVLNPGGAEAEDVGEADEVYTSEDPGGFVEAEATVVEFAEAELAVGDGPAVDGVGYEPHETEAIEPTAPDLVAWADNLVRTGPRQPVGVLLRELAELAGAADIAALSPAAVYDALACGVGSPARSVRAAFEVVASPGREPHVPIQAGDVLLRRGEGGLTHVALLAAGEALGPPAISASGLQPESTASGGYVHVVECGPRPHSLADGFARRLTGSDGRVLADTIVLRPRLPAAEAAAPPAGGRLLRRGSKGPDVREAQLKLNQVHANQLSAGRPGLDKAPLDPDGDFGSRTHAAVVSFQRLAFPGQPAEHDGVIGPKTRAALELFLAPPDVPPVPVPPVPPPPPSPIPRRTTVVPVVIVPGIMGSRLEDPESRRMVWNPLTSPIPCTVGYGTFAANKNRLTNPAPLAPREQHDIPPLCRNDRLRADAIPHFGNLVFRAYSDIAFALNDPAFSARLARSTGRRIQVQVFGCGYDWRQDNADSASRLNQIVTEALRETGGGDDGKVILVAHSQGGLVSRFFCKALGGESKVKSLILLGSPTHGAPQGYRMLKTGVSLLRDFPLSVLFPLVSRLDLMRMLRGFPSVFQLLSTRHFCRSRPDWLLFNTLHTALTLPPVTDASNADALYANTHTGFLDGTNGDPVLDARVSRALLLRSRFDATLFDPATGCYMPPGTHVLFSSGLPTESQYRLKGGGPSGAPFDIDILARGPGDATVPQFSAEANGCGAAARTDVRSVEHGDLPRDAGVIDRVKSIIERVLGAAPVLTATRSGRVPELVH